MTNGLTHFCSLNNGSRFALRLAGDVIIEATKTSSVLAKTDAGEYVTMTDHSEVKRIYSKVHEVTS